MNCRKMASLKGTSAQGNGSAFHRGSKKTTFYRDESDFFAGSSLKGQTLDK